MKVLVQPDNCGMQLPSIKFHKSFGPFVRHLQHKMEQSADIRVKFYRYLLKKFNQHPHLLQPFADATVLEQHEDLVQLLRLTLMPLSDNAKDVAMALAFLEPPSLFYYTPLFSTTFIEESISFNNLEDEVANLQLFLQLVLERCYHINTRSLTRVIKQVVQPAIHRVFHHQVTIDTRFVDVHVHGPLPAFDEQWPKMLTAEPGVFVEWFKTFPAASFSLEGFCMMTAEDVSSEVAINQLKNAVVNSHNTSIDLLMGDVEKALGELAGDARLKAGITPFLKINNRVVYDHAFVNHCAGLLETREKKGIGLTIEDVYIRLSATEGPLLVSDTQTNENECLPYLCALKQSEMKSFAVIPVKNNEGLIGALEIGLPEVGALTPEILERIAPAVPLITELINYMIEMFNNRVDRVVKEKFTPLQHAVEWKFNEVAWQHLLQSESRNPVISDVVFHKVYPIYGAVDVRNSSVERNLASQKDYLLQLEETIEILKQCAGSEPLPLFDALLFKCRQFATSIADVLTSEDELNLQEFFEQEVYTVLRHLGQRHAQLAPKTEAYLQKTDLATGAFHGHRRNYESSISHINKCMSDYFDAQIARLQETYPFYFEKYRTDGVEYNLYIGASIAPNIPFDTMYVKNLRAWQLKTMVEVTHLNQATCSKLPHDLQTTQLILVHGTPIDISFRKDERRFDVDGAYNIRYEILKKRIDKVRVRGTLERLTQPGKIAIVYSNASEIQDYLQHIDYLQHQGLLHDEVEMLELENLQGITGLKAIRVSVHLQNTGQLQVEAWNNAVAV